MKRTGFQRQAHSRIERKEADAVAKLTPKKRVRKCAICRNPFEPRSMTHKACGPLCAQEVARRAAVKQKAREQRQERAGDRAKRERMKTYPALVREAQHAFNAVIRHRDMVAGHACISSGRALDWSGNAVDAGHYRSVGSAPHLRFNEDNVHAQSKHDNQYKSGNAVDYRIGLIARIGLARVEALESNNTPAHWSHDDLRAIRDNYKARLRAAKKET